MALYIGVMSGTSMDGVDAVLCDITPEGCRSIAQTSRPYPAPLKATLRYLARTPTAEISTMARADREVAGVFADTVHDLLQAQNLPADAITAIGSHGQTILHAPDATPPFTLQIGDIATLAVNTGIDVIGDFRSKDVALGGQGAPLAPAFHAFQFADPARTRIVLNIGGIANLSVLPAGNEKTVTGFDTGPGNTLMDAWCLKHLCQPYDENGNWAATGKPDTDLLTVMLADPYFSRPSPKSTGPEYFNLTWLEEKYAALGRDKTILPHDIQATLLSLTAQSIAQAIQALPAVTAATAPQVIICGGGAFNPRLVTAITDALSATPVEVHTSQHLGLHPQWVEGAAFAWLAWAYQHNVTDNLPAVTGASRPAVLGTCCKAR